MLRHEGDLGAKRGFVEVADVRVVEEEGRVSGDREGGWVERHEEGGHCGFPAARRADDGGTFVGWDGEAEVLQGQAIRARGIPKVRIHEFDWCRIGDLSLAEMLVGCPVWKASKAE